VNGLFLIAEKSKNDVMDKILSGYEKPYEAIGLRKSGEEYPLRIEARNVPYKNKTVRSVECRDITEQKQAEEENAIHEVQLQHGQKMEAIVTLAGALAHDFNNILSSIYGYTQLARMHFANPEQQKE